MQRLDELRKFVQTKCLLDGEQQRLPRKDGQAFGWLFDLRRVSSHSKYLETVADYFWQVYKDYWPFQLAGIAVSGVPLATAIMLFAPVPVTSVIIRQVRKNYGTCRIIEGELDHSKPVVLVDDTLGSGETFKAARAELASEGLEVCSIFTIMDLGKHLGGVHRVSMFNPLDFGKTPDHG